MKPSSGNHQLGWSRYRSSQDQIPSEYEAGLDASDNIHVPAEGEGRIFFLTSPFIGQLEMLPVAHRDAEIDVESPAPWRPPKYMAKYDFARRGAREKVRRFVPVRNLVDFPDRFENDRIDMVMPDF